MCSHAMPAFLCDRESGEEVGVAMTVRSYFLYATVTTTTRAVSRCIALACSCASNYRRRGRNGNSGSTQPPGLQLTPVQVYEFSYISQIYSKSSDSLHAYKWGAALSLKWCLCVSTPGNRGRGTATGHMVHQADVFHSAKGLKVCVLVSRTLSELRSVPWILGWNLYHLPRESHCSLCLLRLFLSQGYKTKMQAPRPVAAC